MTIERVAYRPLRGTPRLIPLISAIGVSFFLQDLVRLVESIWRNAFNLVYPSLPLLDRRFELTATVDLPAKSLLVTAASLGMLALLYLVVNRTKLGTAIRAVAEDQATASLMGIDVNRIVSITFLIGGAMGGAAGVLFGIQYGLVNPYSGFIPGLKAFTAAVQGTTNQAVTWTVQEGAAGGSITAGGIYTAPALPGTYHVVATSQADPTRKATVDVVVQAGNASGVIQ